MHEDDKRTPSKEEIDEESRRIRRLRIAVNLALNIIAQGQLPLEEALELVAATRRVALQLFQDKGDTYDLIYRPKFQQLLSELYRLQ
jgi:predicted HTH domain antitoxin